MNKQHTLQQFDNELEEIRTKLMKMGGQVEEMMKFSIVGFATGNTAQLKEVLEMEHRVNALEVEIDEICNNVIARRQPIAYDLRLLVASLKMIRDLER